MCIRGSRRALTSERYAPRAAGAPADIRAVPAGHSQFGADRHHAHTYTPPWPPPTRTRPPRPRTAARRAALDPAASSHHSSSSKFSTHTDEILSVAEINVQLPENSESTAAKYKNGSKPSLPSEPRS